MSFRLNMNSTSSKQPNLFDSSKKKIKKRHWFLASIIVVAGSWITHTTTANIDKSDTLLPVSPVEQSIDLTQVAGFAPPAKINDADPTITSVLETNTQGLASPKLETIVEPNLTTVTHLIKRGESLGIIFKKLSLGSSLPYKISTHETAKRLVSLSAGRELTFKLDDEDNLHSISYPSNKLQNFVVSFEDQQVSSAKTVDLPFQTQQQIASGEITSSLYEAAVEVGMNIGIVMEMVRIFGWDVDFVLDIRSGDHFHVIYESHFLGDKWLSDGNILAAEFTTQGNTYRAVRFEDESGDVSFYTPEGDSMLGTFLRSPVEFSRISSRFGKRKHPILKTWRAHNGVDYAAARGTPIRSTADGKVVHVGKKGGYGRTVIINHAGRFSTLYAHMNGYAKGLKSGARVKQGQTIGYVGSSGLATGPHLHYEFRVDGVHRNSLTYKTPKANSIKPESKPEFERVALPLLAQLDAIEQSYKLAKSVGTSKAIIGTKESDKAQL